MVHKERTLCRVTDYTKIGGICRVIGYETGAVKQGDKKACHRIFPLERFSQGPFSRGYVQGIKTGKLWMFPFIQTGVQGIPYPLCFTGGLTREYVFQGNLSSFTLLYAGNSLDVICTNFKHGIQPCNLQNL